jgi:hypothetical protein
MKSKGLRWVLMAEGKKEKFKVCNELGKQGLNKKV